MIGKTLNQYKILDEVAPDDWGAIQKTAVSVMRSSASYGEPLGMWPDVISISSPLADEDVRTMFNDSIVGWKDVAVGYAEWMQQNGYGTWSIETEDDRAALADEYVDAVLRSS